MTKTIKYSSIGKICLFDCPGSKDPDYKKNGLSNTNISIMLTETLRRLLRPQKNEEFE